MLTTKQFEVLLWMKYLLESTKLLANLSSNIYGMFDIRNIIHDWFIFLIYLNLKNIYCHIPISKKKVMNSN